MLIAINETSKASTVRYAAFHLTLIWIWLSITCSDGFTWMKTKFPICPPERADFVIFFLLEYRFSSERNEILLFHVAPLRQHRKQITPPEHAGCEAVRQQAGGSILSRGNIVGRGLGDVGCQRSRIWEVNCARFINRRQKKKKQALSEQWVAVSSYNKHKVLTLNVSIVFITFHELQWQRANTHTFIYTLTIPIAVTWLISECIVLWNRRKWC